MPEWFEKVTIGDLLDRLAHRFGEREALTFAGQRWSFQQLQTDSDRAARGLMQCGIQPGDKVALWLTNCPEWLHILFAVAKIGAVLVPINTRFRTTDLEYVLRQSDTRMLITTDYSGPIGYLDKVIDPATGHSVPYGTSGELCCRGYGVMQGYYKKPEETAQAIDAEGWLHSGDIVKEYPMTSSGKVQKFKLRDSSIEALGL